MISAPPCIRGVVITRVHTSVCMFGSIFERKGGDAQSECICIWPLGGDREVFDRIT